MVERVRRSGDSKTPFLTVKYGVTFVGITSNCYDLVLMDRNKLQYLPVSRRDVVRVLREFDIPMLWNAGDSHNTIWGDERFKDKFKEGGYKI